MGENYSTIFFQLRELSMQVKCSCRPASTSGFPPSFWLEESTSRHWTPFTGLVLAPAKLQTVQSRLQRLNDPFHLKGAPKHQENWRAKNINGWVYPWCPSCFALQLSGSIFCEVANEGGGPPVGRCALVARCSSQLGSVSFSSGLRGPIVSNSVGNYQPFLKQTAEIYRNITNACQDVDRS